MSSGELIANPFDTVTLMLTESIDRRKRVAEDLAGKIPDMLEALVQCALGVWKEKEITNRKGEHVRTVVYQVAPDSKAIQALIRLGGYDPEEISAILLSMSRIRSIEADVEADLAKAKANNLKSQSLLNEKNALAFEAAFVVEEDVQGAALSVFSALVGYIQSIPYEVMHGEISVSQAPYQAWQEKLAEIGTEAYRQFTLDKPAIGSGEDETDDEEEEDE